MKLRYLGPIPDTGHAIRKEHAKKVVIADQNLICFSLAFLAPLGLHYRIAGNGWDRG